MRIREGIRYSLRSGSLCWSLGPSAVSCEGKKGDEKAADEGRYDRDQLSARPFQKTRSGPWDRPFPSFLGYRLHWGKPANYFIPLTVLSSLFLSIRYEETTDPI